MPTNDANNPNAETAATPEKPARLADLWDMQQLEPEAPGEIEPKRRASDASLADHAVTDHAAASETGLDGAERFGEAELERISRSIAGDGALDTGSTEAEVFEPEMAEPEMELLDDEAELELRDHEAELFDADDEAVERADDDSLSEEELVAAGVVDRPKRSAQATSPGLLSRFGIGNKSGGVAPIVNPPGRFARFRAARRWSRKGFVPMTPRTQKMRHRILPRTVIGIASMFMAAGIGAAFAGAVFYAYYDDRLAENEAEVARFVDGFDQQFTTATGTLDQLRLDSIDEIRDELDPLGDYVSDRNGVVNLPAATGSAIWTLQTVDEEGKPVVGTAFAVTGHEGGTALVTSLSLVRSATLEPSPGITLVKGSIRNEATLWSWDEEHDLALIIVDVELPTLSLAAAPAQLDSIGARVFAMSGTGSQGATASPGVLLDQSALGVQHTAVIGDLFVGGPIIDSEGLVVGVVTNEYVPLGIEPGAVALMPDIPSVCSRILRCPSTDELVIGELIVSDLIGEEGEG